MKIFRRIAYVVMLGIAAVCLATPSVSAQQRAEQETYVQPQATVSGLPQDTYDLILAVTRKRSAKGHIAIGLQRGETSFAPMLQLARIVRFSADADFKAGVISGFFNTSENTFSVDAHALTYTVRGETHDLPPDSIIVLDQGGGLGEFYLSIEILNQIWPLMLEMDQSEMALRMMTPQKLPYEREEERRLRQSLLGLQNGQEGPVTDGLTFVPNDYKLISKPVLGLSHQLSVGQKDSQVKEQISVSGRNDLLYTSADYNAQLEYRTGSRINLDRLRLRLTRRALKGDELPLGLRMVQAGDITVRPPDLLKGTIGGRGVYVSTAPVKRAQDFDQVTVEGTGPPGWEVELYRGRELYDFGYVSQDGTYLFDEVALGYGRNEIRVVLYGPEGQVHEDTRTYNITSSMLKTGETVLDASAIEANRDVIETGDQPEQPVDGAYSGFTVRHGINERMTGFGTVTRMNTNDGTKTYVSAGADMAVPGGVGRVELYKDLAGGAAIDGRYATQFAGLNLNMRGALFKDFESQEVSPGANKKTSELELRATRAVTLPFTRLGLNFNAKHTKFDNGGSRTQIGAGENFSLGILRLNNSTRTTLEDGEHVQTNGRISANARLNRQWRVRTDLNYDLHPNPGADSVGFEVLYNGRNGFSASVRAREDLEQEGRSVGLHGAYDNGHFLNSLDLNWQTTGGVNLIWRATTALGPYGRDGQYISRSGNLIGSSPIAANIYQDKNYNGVFDGDDEALEGVQLKVAGRRTDESAVDGFTSMTDAGSIGLADISVVRNTLENPFLVSADNGYYTVLRPGAMPLIDIPMVMSGTIDGHVNYADGRPVAGIRLLLVDAEGTVVDETSTSFDGFYTFEYVKPGAYEVRAAPEYEFQIPPIAVWVASDDLFAYGTDLKVLEQADEAGGAEAAEEAVIRARGRVAQPNHDVADAPSGKEQPAPNSSDGRFSVVANRVRIGEHPGKVRLVMDLSDATDYKITEEANGQIVNIDLPDTAWDSLKSWRGANTPILDGFKALKLAEGGTRLQLKARDVMHVSVSGMLLPSSGNPTYRLYIDLTD